MWRVFVCAEVLESSAGLVAVEAIHRLVARGLKRKLCDACAALGAGDVDVIHGAWRAGASVVWAAVSALGAKTVAAVDRLVARRLEWQLADVRTALGAVDINVEHLSVLLIHTNLRMCLNEWFSTFFAAHSHSGRAGRWKNPQLQKV